VIGSADKPVLLVVNGGITMSGSSQIYGLVFSISGSASFSGTSTVIGSMVTNKDITVSGNFNYDSKVLRNLSNNQSLVVIPGSWADY
jgi:hypothetical protein